MKKQINLPLLAILTGAILFSAIFWMERLALNLLIYSVFLTAILLLDSTILKSRKLIGYLSAHLLTALMVVYNNSDLTVFAWVLSLIVLVGFAHGPQIRSIFMAIAAALWQGLAAPVNFISQLASVRIGNFSLQPIMRLIKYLIIPFFFVMLFIIIYCNANKDFANYVEIFGTNIANFISNIFSFFFADLSFLRVVHFVFGILVTTAVVIGVKTHFIQKAELSLSEEMIRDRKDKTKRGFLYDMLEIFASDLLKRKTALKTENTIGIISFGALNFLLLFLNAIDISKLWLGLGSTAISHSSEVHDGTNALIFSIIMAMMVILYFFKGNLNFYSKNKIMKALAYTWIIQNTFLIASVLLRDYHYIEAHGLTHKRIGVLVFLLLCSIGLFTVYLKVAKKKTLFFLCKLNGFSWYVILIASCFVNWDVEIVRYNINHSEVAAVDVDYLFSLSNKALPLLDQNKNLLKRYLSTHTTVQPNSSNDLLSASNIDDKINFRLKWFNETQKETSWLSWNYRDWQTKYYFSK